MNLLHNEAFLDKKSALPNKDSSTKLERAVTVRNYILIF